MGSAIAGRLDEAGFELVLWNRTRSRAEALGLGAIADTPAAAASDVDIIISSLTGPDAVLAAYLGPDGALATGAGKRFIEMSTAGPGLVADLAPQVAAAGGTLVDAPILGAPPLVRAGEAAILVGGASENVADVRPVLSLFGTVRHVGPLGSAARLKLVANSMLADVILAAAELQVAGEDAGLDPDDVFFVLNRVAPSLGATAGGSPGSRHADVVRAARPGQGCRPGDGALWHVGGPDPVDPVVARTGRCGRCRDARPRYQRGREALPAGSVGCRSGNCGPVGRTRCVNAMTATMAVRSPKHRRSGCELPRCPTNGRCSASSAGRWQPLARRLALQRTCADLRPAPRVPDSA